ncbi:MAG TPA: DoxX family protein [Salinivirgaceae bacterium]|nr:DoxX family protein [Salinivirgaceae bacterium]
MKIIRNISRLLVGLVFLFSGFVKAVDPMGSQFKFNDYFVAFGIEWLMPLALVFAIMLAATEFIVGFALLNNSFTRFFAWIALIFMLFFTVLTFILAIKNPVTDCGCFGDAIILTNWQTFYKNLVILIPTFILFWQRKYFKSSFEKLGMFFQSAVGVTIVAVVIGVSLKYLPLIDFRPYRVGQNIALASKEHLVGAPKPLFETTLIYEKNGVKQSFSLNNLPDSTWNWVETINRTISEGYSPKIKNFHLMSLSGNDITDRILNHEQPVLMICIWDLSKISEQEATYFNQIAYRAQESNIYTIMVTSATPSEIEQYERNYLPTFSISTADPITLKTIVRDNGGIVFLYKGTVLQKWNHRAFFDPLEITEYRLLNEAMKKGSPNPMMQTIFYLLIIVLISLILEWIGLYTKKHINRRFYL